MPYLVLGIAVLFGLWLASRWYVNAQPATILKALRWLGVILAVGLVGLVAFSKQVTWLLFAIPVLLPWLMRARGMARTARNWQRMAGGAAGQGKSSQVETQFLRMYLDHNTGEMNGEVLRGRFAERQLGDMALDDLLDLMGECAGDDQSVQVLAAYLERQYPDEWRDRAHDRGAAGGGAGRGGPGRGGNGAMSRDEAYEILGLSPGASDDDIRDAHHRLMAKIHPDHGGSTYLATKINQAKDLLLG